MNLTIQVNTWWRNHEHMVISNIYMVQENVIFLFIYLNKQIEFFKCLYFGEHFVFKNMKTYVCILQRIRN